MRLSDTAARVGSAFQDVTHFDSANQRAQVAVDLEGGPLCSLQGGAETDVGPAPRR